MFNARVFLTGRFYFFPCSRPQMGPHPKQAEGVNFPDMLNYDSSSVKGLNCLKNMVLHMFLSYLLWEGTWPLVSLFSLNFSNGYKIYKHPVTVAIANTFQMLNKCNLYRVTNYDIKMERRYFFWRGVSENCCWWMNKNWQEVLVSQWYNLGGCATEPGTEFLGSCLQGRKRWINIPYLFIILLGCHFPPLLSPKWGK